MKKHPVLKTLGIILAVIVVFFAVINIIPPKKNVENNPFMVGKDGLPMIAAVGSWSCFTFIWNINADVRAKMAEWKKAKAG